MGSRARHNERNEQHELFTIRTLHARTDRHVPVPLGRSPKVSGACDFSDVSAGSFCHDAVIWASSEGITKGTSAGRFSPNEGCTRAQVVTFLYRASGGK